MLSSKSRFCLFSPKVKRHINILRYLYGYFINQTSLSCKTDAVGVVEWNANYILNDQLYSVNSTGFKTPSPSPCQPLASNCRMKSGRCRNEPTRLEIIDSQNVLLRPICPRWSAAEDPVIRSGRHKTRFISAALLPLSKPSAQSPDQSIIPHHQHCQQQQHLAACPAQNLLS